MPMVPGPVDVPGALPPRSATRRPALRHCGSHARPKENQTDGHFRR
jgi:hypothetical protein